MMPKNIENMPNDNPDFFIAKVPDKRFYSFVPRVAYIGHTISLPDTKFSVYQRTELEFCFRLSSAEQYAEDKIDDQVYCSEFPHLLIKHPGTLHRYRTEFPRTAFFLIYSADAVRAFERADIDLAQFVHPFQITPEIQNLLTELLRCEEQIHEPDTPDRIDLLAVRLITEVISQSRRNSRVLPHQNDIRQIAAYIESHFNEPLDFSSLAEKSGMSLRSFFRHWKENYRESPAQFLLSCRMEFAKHLLLRSSMNISQIADNAGFSSSGYFVQSFKRYYGKTPAAMRRECMQNVKTK